MSSNMTLEDFASLLSQTGVTDKEDLIAKKANIVIATNYGWPILLSGALDYEFNVEDEYGRVDSIYFDGIGVLNDYLYYEIEGYKSNWEEFLNRMGKHYYKLDGLFSKCNFPYKEFIYDSGDYASSIRGIIFYKPKFDGIYLNKYRDSTYNSHDYDNDEDAKSSYWTCDACDGNQDTGCLSTVGRCFR
jgi:hypothetical protein